nr:SET domain-containing protein-lysine N-methyltransferase [Paraburkholderia sp. BL27I4N3]
MRRLEAGERIFEYKGERIAWRTTIRQYGKRGTFGHTFFFGLSDGRVIDGGLRGNSARRLNHSCNANCEAIELEDRVFIHATSAIAPGEELFLDYRLEVDETPDEGTRLCYACRCGSAGCRGTMLAAGSL